MSQVINYYKDAKDAHINVTNFLLHYRESDLYHNCIE